MSDGYTEFDTEIGRCSIAWGADGIVGVRLPGRPRIQTQTEPTPEIKAAIAGIQSLLRGESSDLSAIKLDMQGVPMGHRRVYEAARTIPPGATVTYGEIARRLGDPALAREVGQALAKNPFAIVVPCHRVVASNGKLGGFSAAGGTRTKQRMLAIEGSATQPMFPS
jgi:O-6-methylguanine DNA methyltransferase